MELLSDYINKLQIFLAVTGCPVPFYSDKIQSDFIYLFYRGAKGGYLRVYCGRLW